MFTQVLCYMYQISTYRNASCVVNNYICVLEIWFDHSLTVCEIFIKVT
ncbi:hypothetical protein NP493_7869g00001 [Ridgeia piscesae]|uniref:Uncharacterized protein n=1 Tax=Ridgeia piscesae TaxID=27915 RepID=A0AAD9INM6_RIDPI|nr:hypothetical protein NP493_7869g00001 [Ridgeia piscesae]